MAIKIMKRYRCIDKLDFNGIFLYYYELRNREYDINISMYFK